MSRWARLDALVYSLERVVVGSLFFAMGTVVFVDVVHRIFSRSPGRLSTLLAPVVGVSAPELDTLASPALILITTFLLAYGAVQSRARASGPALPVRRALALALAATAALTAGVQLFLRILPEGLVWAPYGALVTLLWVGLIGASMATHKGRHLALEMGEKLWPEAARPWVRKLAHVVAAAFALLIVVLGSVSLADHFAAWRESPSSDLIPAVDWPKWIVFAVVPYAFGMIAVRLLGRAAGLLPEAEPPEVPT